MHVFDEYSCTSNAILWTCRASGVILGWRAKAPCSLRLRVPHLLYQLTVTHQQYLMTYGSNPQAHDGTDYLNVNDQLHASYLLILLCFCIIIFSEKLLYLKGNRATCCTIAFVRALYFIVNHAMVQTPFYSAHMILLVFCFLSWCLLYLE